MAQWLRAVWAVAFLVLGAGWGQAQDYPNRLITIVVPGSPGGIPDILARVVEARLEKLWNQRIVVDNKQGANTQIATVAVAKAAPDGYTLLVTPKETFAVNPVLYRNLGYDPVNDFEPITGLAKVRHALVVNKDLPVQTVKDLIDLARKKPGELNYGTFGVGSSSHLNTEMFGIMAGIKLTPVHYRGQAPALTDVVAGHIQMLFLSARNATEPWKGGLVKLLGVGSPARMSALPEIPTIAESNGLSGYEAESSFGLFAPRGTPPEIIAKINAAVQGIFNDPSFRAAVLDPQYLESMVSTPADFKKYLASEADKAARIVREANIKVE
jgi:tripartite-type tricarboxylate transporter receptor subunit TctC